ncbi:MAG: alpha/beta fold hydrolase, partial [Candidatus Heimdallarchaeaceae archaeon]
MHPAFIVLIVVSAIIVLIILPRILYVRWVNLASKVMDEGEVIETATGKIHYKLIGEGPVLFFMHGGPGGIDQAIFIEDTLEEGFSILSVSRPGYLRTPFTPLS